MGIQAKMPFSPKKFAECGEKCYLCMLIYSTESDDESAWFG